MELLEGETLKHRIAGRPFKVDQLLDLPSRSPTRWTPHTPAASCIATSSRPTFSSPKRGQVKILDFGLAKLTPQNTTG